MLTNPNTLGLFDTDIAEITGIVREAGGTLYYDGANLNAIMGHSRPGDMGFDIVHVNLHKSFSQPHGGGGPGAGPIAVSERIEPYLPVPRIERSRGPTTATARASSSTAPTATPRRSAACAASRATSASSSAPTPTSSASAATAWRRPRRRRCSTPTTCSPGCARDAPASYLPLAFERRPMHEFVLSGRGAKKELGLRTLDIAKRLLDHSMHPPTVYFPLLVDEALMIEPTETETKESLDGFADAVESILAEAEHDPEIARQAPYTTPVRRLDEAGAARNPVVRQPAG